MSTNNTDALVVRERLRRSATEYNGSSTSRGIRGAVIGQLNEGCGGDERRRAFMGFVFGMGEPMSASYINDAEILALYEWIGFYSEDGEWCVSCIYKNELSVIMKEIENGSADEGVVSEAGQSDVHGV